MNTSLVSNPTPNPTPQGRSQARRRKTGVILKSSPCVLDDAKSENSPLVPSTTEGHMTHVRPKAVRIVLDKEKPHSTATAEKSLPVEEKGFHSRKNPTERKVYHGEASHPPVPNPNGLFDAKSEKSHSYLKAGGKAMKSSMLYQESASRPTDVVEARRKLRQLQINYSKTNANLNDRVIMCDILKVTFHQVIPRIKLMNALERRVYNLRLRSRRRILAMGEDTKNMTKTICELKKEREERIKNKQRPPRRVDTLKDISAEDIAKLRTCCRASKKSTSASKV